MCYLHAVQLLESAYNLLEYVLHLLLSEGGIFAKVAFKIPLLAVFHDEIKAVLRSKEVDELHDVLMLELLENRDFGVDSVLEIFVTLDLPKVKSFDGYSEPGWYERAFVYLSKGSLSKALHGIVRVVAN